MPDSALIQEIKEVLVDELMLDLTYEEIEPEIPLMGPESLGLDSVDALQLVVALEKRFGLKIKDAEEAQKIFLSVAAIASAVEAHQGSAS